MHWTFTDRLSALFFYRNASMFLAKQVRELVERNHRYF